MGKFSFNIKMKKLFLTNFFFNKIVLFPVIRYVKNNVKKMFYIGLISIQN